LVAVKPILFRTLLLLAFFAVPASAQHRAPAASCPAASVQRQSHVSPDGSLVAVICSVAKPGNAPESFVQIQKGSGKILARREYTSSDGSHGYGVTEASWTPDSQFFVFSLASSGGHSPWHSPVQYFHRKDGKDGIVSLDDALRDSIMNPHFLIAAPDLITVNLWFSRQTRTVSLSSLQQRRSK